jgi:hypothetical protein
VGGLHEPFKYTKFAKNIIDPPKICKSVCACKGVASVTVGERGSGNTHQKDYGKYEETEDNDRKDPRY